jgi:hypothetical protein
MGCGKSEAGSSGYKMDVSNSDQLLPSGWAIIEPEMSILLSTFRFSELSQPI